MFSKIVDRRASESDSDSESERLDPAGGAVKIRRLRFTPNLIWSLNSAAVQTAPVLTENLSVASLQGDTALFR